MNWIEISNIDSYNIEGENILIWQKNLTDNECSRFQRAVYFKGNNKISSYIRLYPLTYKQIYKQDEEWLGYDLEGDKCQITHFAIVKSPYID